MTKQGYGYSAREYALLAAAAQLGKFQGKYWKKKARLRNYKYKALSVRTRSRRRNRWKARTVTRRKVRKMSKQIRKLQRKTNQGIATHTHRNMNNGELKSNFNEAKFNAVTSNARTQLETALSSLRYYDATTNALITNDGQVNTYQQKYRIESVWNKLILRNNYKVTNEVRVYCCIPKKDTSISPQTAFEGGLVDQGNPSKVSTLAWLTDSDQFNDLWKIKKYKTYYLKPGQSCSMTYVSPGFDFSPADIDSHTDTFQRGLGCCVFMVRQMGPVAHVPDNSNDYGRIEAGLDYECRRTYKIRYDAGAQLNDYSYNTVDYETPGVGNDFQVSELFEQQKQYGE